MSGAGWIESTGSVLSSEIELFVAQSPSSDGSWDKHQGDAELLGCEPRTVSTCWNATSKMTQQVSHQGGHRSRRPAACRSRDGTGTRESLTVSCCLQPRIINGETLRGSPPRDQSSRLKGLHRRVDRDYKRGERRYDVTSRKAKERRMDVRQS